jgi:hypothetical protein
VPQLVFTQRPFLSLYLEPVGQLLAPLPLSLSSLAKAGGVAKANARIVKATA